MAIRRAAEAVQARVGPTRTSWVTMPTPERPYLIVSTRGADDRHWIADAEGRIVRTVRESWTDFLVGLHADLHVPGTAGHMLVGLTGVVLMALVVGGLLAHPGLVKDAFRLRLCRAPRTRQADLHNRGGVWSLPFLFVLGLSGALMGLSAVLIGGIAGAGLAGGPAAASAAVLGPRAPKAEGAAPLPDLGALAARMRTVAPHAELGGLVVFAPGTAAQTVRADVKLPGRLAFGDRYFFDGALRPLRDTSLLDSAAGLPVYAGLVALHFGGFGGLPIKIAYALLGLAACGIIHTGMRLWFLRRRRDAVAGPFERLWTALAWGTPLALAASFPGQAWLGLPPVALFYGFVMAALLAAAVRSRPGRSGPAGSSGRAASSAG